MENENKKKNKPEIDEEFLMNIIADCVQKDGLNIPPEPPPKQEAGKEPEKSVIRGKAVRKKPPKPIMKIVFQESGNQCP